MGRLTLSVILLLVLLATAFWWVFWLQSADSALTRAPQLDEAFYLREAARVRADGGVADVPFVMSPGYPLLVAIGGGEAPVDGILRAHPRGLLAVQALAWLACGLLVAGVVRGAGRRAGLTDRAALFCAVTAALLFLLYRPAAIFARTVLLEVPLTVLVTASVAAILATRPGVLVRAVVAGLCLGLAAGLRAHVLVLLLLLVPLVWRAAASSGRRAAATALLVITALGPVALASLHNTRTTGDPAGPSLNAGINLYLGLQPGTGGLFTTLVGFDLEHDPAGEAFLARRLDRPIDGPGEADRVWRAEARRRWRQEPGQAMAGWLRKTWLHLQGWEIAQVTPLSAWSDEAPVLRLLPVTWGLLVIAACVGAAVAWGRQAMIWMAVVGLLIATQSLFFVVSRYRLVLGPSLAVLAGLGLVAALTPGGRGHWRRWRGPLLVLPLAVLLTVPWGLSEVRQAWRGLEDFNHARRLLVMGEPDDRERAELLLAGTCAATPGHSAPWQLRTENLLQLGRHEAALTTLADGLLQVDDPVALERFRLTALRRIGRLDQAEALTLVYLRDHPDDLDMLHDLVVLQGERGRWSAAADTARRLLAAAPDDHRGWLDQAVAMAQLGRRDEAIALLRNGLDRVPAGVGRDLLAENLRRLEARAGGR